MKKYIKYNTDNNTIDIDSDLWLMKEFNDLRESKRNITKTDKKGDKKELAYKEVHFMFMYLDWQSPYFKFSEEEKLSSSIIDAGLTKEHLADLTFKEACRKYIRLQEGSIELRMLKGTMASIENVIYYFEHLDVNERDPETNKPTFKTKDVIAEIKGAKELIKSIRDLENEIKSGFLEKSELRGDEEVGAFD